MSDEPDSSPLNRSGSVVDDEATSEESTGDTIDDMIDDAMGDAIDGMDNATSDEMDDATSDETIAERPCQLDVWLRSIVRCAAQVTCGGLTILEHFIPRFVIPLHEAI